MNTERQAWLAGLYQSNLSPVFKTCSRVLRNREDAADASQDVFLIAASSLQAGTSGAAAAVWLQTVARNHCLDVLRRQKRLGRALVTLGADGDSGPDPAAAVADRDFVYGVFKKLSPRERQALWLSAVERRPIEDIAGRLRLSYAAAAQAISRARRHALALAARVAIVFAILRLGRRVSRISLMAARVATVPIITISAIAIQSSGTPATAAIASGSAISVPAVHPALPSVVPSILPSTIASALDVIQQAIDRASGLGITAPSPAPLVIPAIPPLPTDLRRNAGT